MGREIRRVPPNWQHPKEMGRNGKEDYKRLLDEDFDSAAKEWKEEFAKWESGDFPSHASDESKALEFWEWHGRPPDRDSYRPAWKEGEATWFQVYETVSEGTPVSPPFATREELVEYLVAHGDFWSQQRGQGGFSRKAAEQFVKDEYAPSMISANGKVTVGIETAAIK